MICRASRTLALVTSFFVRPSFHSKNLSITSSLSSFPESIGLDITAGADVAVDAGCVSEGDACRAGIGAGGGGGGGVGGYWVCCTEGARG